MDELALDPIMAPDTVAKGVDVILEQEEIQVIQFTPGAGSPLTGA